MIIVQLCQSIMVRAKDCLINAAKSCSGFERIVIGQVDIIILYMCVDDYAFRHFSAVRDKVCKKFVFVDEEEFAKTFYVNISQFEEFGDVALCKILIYLSSKGLNIENKKFYLPKFMAIIEPFTFCRIIFESLDQKEILLKVYSSDKSSEEIFAENQDQTQQFQSVPQDEENYYCRFEDPEAKEVMELFAVNEKTKETDRIQTLTHPKIEEQNTGEERMIDESQERSHQKSDDHHKKSKQSERVIGQVISAVKIWRGLYESKRCNLTNAAKVVGISKKSLDDYFLVLRVGQILGYDFERNLHNLMGDLRNFIRAQEEKVTGKLGKTVKCFQLVEDVDLDKLMQQFQTEQRLHPKN